MDSNIVTAHRAGARAWPACQLDLATFAKHVDVVRISDARPRHPADLYLACAAANGDSRAVAEIARRLRAIVRAIGRTRLLKRILATLLVARSESRPRIADYRGAGPLAAWLRGAVVRGCRQG